MTSPPGPAIRWPGCCGDKCLAIDLIGFPGEGEGFLELERYLVLAAPAWKPCR